MKTPAIHQIALGAVLLALPLAPAHAADYVAQAKAFIAKVTAPVNTWADPTTGPRAVPHKLVVYVSTDQRNGGARGVGQGAAQAAKVVGWDFRVLDGQGTVSGQTSAMGQAIALKPNGIILGGVDALQEAPAVAQAEKLGIKVVGWHAGPKPGPMATPPVFANITTDPLQVAKAAALYAVAQSNGHAGVVIFTDSAYKIAIAKSDAMAAAIRQCTGCKVLAVEDTPLANVSSRMPQLATTLLQRFGAKWTYSLGINDLYFDFIAPSLQAAGIGGNGHPSNISAGDGSASAFQRIRTKQYQVATAAEPLTLQGWECIDELNRAFAGQKWSGYVPPVHLFTLANIKSDGGPNNIYDPNNSYRAIYTKIWTGK
ncbi:MAG TPA: substrate-binding domain-containing protein [Acetobacteraceae bacterium]|nr:substrate-binding domain-containing protein [Acetobacteraceae bacterium]